jgi:hypothetical protein
MCYTICSKRNSRSQSPRARCKPHTAPPDLLTARLLSTRHVRPSSILCIRSPTPATVLVAARHATPVTCTPRDKQTRFSERDNDKRKTKQNYLRFKFKHHQINVSHLIFSRRDLEADLTSELNPPRLPEQLAPKFRTGGREVDGAMAVIALPGAWAQVMCRQCAPPPALLPVRHRLSSFSSPPRSSSSRTAAKKN